MYLPRILLSSATGLSRVLMAHGAEPHLYKCQRLFNSQQNLLGHGSGFSGTLCVESVTRLQCQGCPGGQLPHCLPTPSPLSSSSKHKLNNRIMITMYSHSTPRGRGVHWKGHQRAPGVMVMFSIAVLVVVTQACTLVKLTELNTYDLCISLYMKCLRC